LADALAEAGFVKSRLGEAVAEDADVIRMQVRRTDDEFSCPEFIEVNVPAYFAARRVPDLCATR
jgi:hypothetical protein